MNWDPAMLIPTDLPLWAWITVDLMIVAVAFPTFLFLFATADSALSLAWTMSGYPLGQPQSLKGIMMSVTIIPITALVIQAITLAAMYIAVTSPRS